MMTKIVFVQNGETDEVNMLLDKGWNYKDSIKARKSKKEIVSACVIDIPCCYIVLEKEG